MPDKALERLLVEVKSALDDGSISQADRRLLERVRDDLEAASRNSSPGIVAAVAPPARTAGRSTSQLRETLNAAVERLEMQHPRLTSLLGKTLDALSDLGV